MKKLIATLTVILGMGMTTFAQDEAFGGGGLLQRGKTPQYNYFADWSDLGWMRDGIVISSSGITNDDFETPLGSGLVILLGAGLGYMALKRKEDKQ